MKPSRILAKAHPFVKLLIFAEVVCLGFLGHYIGATLGLLFLMLFVTAHGVMLAWLRRLLVAVFPLLLLILVIHVAIPFFAGSPATTSFSIALFYCLRILLMVGAVIAFALIVSRTELAGLVLAAPLPLEIRLVVLSALNLLSEVRLRFRSVIEAQSVRGIDTSGTLLRRLTNLPSLIFPVVLRILDEAGNRAIALELRGLGPSTNAMTLFLSSPLNWIERRIAYLLGGLLLATALGALMT